jgi:ribosomal protein S6--L-glutamate ligase
VGGKVIAAFKRQGQEGEFRSNLHRGGVGKKVRLSAEEKKTAIAATKALGLNIAGVDMLRSDRGPLVLEVNSSPGIEGVETVTGIDVADKIIAFVEKQIERPLVKTKDKVGV